MMSMDHERLLTITERTLRSALLGYLFIMSIPHTAALRSALFILALLCLAIRCTLTKSLPFRRTPLDIPILMYTAVILITTMISIDPAYSLMAIRKEFLRQILIFYLVINSMETSRYTQRLLVTVMISISVVACIGLFGYFEGSLIKGGRATSYFGSFGRAAFFTSMILPIALGRFLCSKKVVRTLSLFVLLLCMGFMIVTMSRGAWISSLLAVSILAALKDRRMLVLLLIGVISAPWFLPANVIDRATTIISVFEFSGNETFGDRFWLWKSAVEMIRDNFFLGSGHGNRIFQMLYPDYMDSRSTGIIFENAHNLYLQIAVESGIIGLSAFLLLIGFIIGIILKILRHKPDPLVEGQILGIAGSFAVFLIFSFTTFRYENEIGVLFWALTGCVVAIYREIFLRREKRTRVLFGNP